MLKPGKKANELGNYRPISLTSVIGKVERILCNRLKDMNESGNLFSPFQTGFRLRRSTEDQLLRLSQSIADGFQQNPMQRTLMMLIGFSKAYAGVWRDALLLIMAKEYECRWFAGFKNGCQTGLTG